MFVLIPLISRSRFFTGYIVNRNWLYSLIFGGLPASTSEVSGPAPIPDPAVMGTNKWMISKGPESLHFADQKGFIVPHILTLNKPQC